MREGVFLVALALTVCLVQISPAGSAVPMAYKPDLMVVAVIWASLRIRLEIGMAFAFGGGMLMDMFSGAPAGLFVVIYCITFVVCAALNTTLSLDQPSVRMITASMATMASGAVILVTTWFSGPIDGGFLILFRMTGKSIITGIACLIAFPVLDRAMGAFSRIIGALQ